MSNAPSRAAAADAFYAAFLENLRADLTLNSKPVITSLTQIAGENKPFARAIVDALRDHILEVCEACSGSFPLRRSRPRADAHPPPPPPPPRWCNSVSLMALRAVMCGPSESTTQHHGVALCSGAVFVFVCLLLTQSGAQS